jgi:PAB1-binding protein PBP1
MELIQKDIDDLRMYESVNESYMGNKGDEVMITNTKKPDGDIPGNWVLEKPDGSAMVDMFFNSKEAAKKYAKGKELKLVPGFKEDINEDFTHSSLAITDQSQISGLDDLELLDLLNRVSYEYTPELKNAARIIAQEIEDRNLTSKIHYVDNKRYEFKESVGVEEEIETSLTSNEIGDLSVEKESDSAAYESLQESLRKKLKARLK